MELILPKLIGIFGVIFLFGFAVFIHEFGHFISAKIFGVGVSKFAIGFGPKMISKQWGETEYSIRWIPLGGFVSLKGMVEDQEEVGGDGVETKDKAEAQGEKTEQPDSGAVAEKGSITEDLDALRNKPAWQRIIVFGSGVACNFVLAIFLVALLMMIGDPAPPELPNYLEEVPEDAKLYDLGWRTGDRIVDIEQAPVSSLRPVLERARAAKPPTSEETFQRWRDVSQGINEIMAPHSETFRTWGAIKRAVFDGKQAAFTSPTLVATVERGGSYLRLPVPPTVWDNPEEMEHFSPPRPPHIGAIIPSTPAHRARLVKDNYTLGEKISPYPMWENMPQMPLKAGDMIVAINDQPVATWAKMSEILRENPNEQITLTVRRGEGEDERLMLLTTMLERDDEEQQGRLGVYYTPPPGKGPREGEPIHKALWKAPMRTLQLTDLIVYETVSVFTRSPREIKRNVGGPIVIGIMAYREAQRGLYHYLKLFAMICIILSIMNLLPIPILDGGYIAITLVEGIIGRPLPRKVIEPLLTIFFILFMLLFGWIFFNDIMNWVVKQ